MFKTTRTRPTLAPLALLLGAALALPGASSAATDDTVAKGRALAFDRAKGNCLACHVIPGGESPGQIGPPLVSMKSRFPDRDALRAQLWDPAVRNPATIMPPFGRHRLLSEAEIEAVVDFLDTL